MLITQSSRTAQQDTGLAAGGLLLHLADVFLRLLVGVQVKHLPERRPLGIQGLENAGGGLEFRHLVSGISKGPFLAAPLDLNPQLFGSWAGKPFENTGYTYA